MFSQTHADPDSLSLSMNPTSAPEQGFYQSTEYQQQQRKAGRSKGAHPSSHPGVQITLGSFGRQHCPRTRA